MSSSGKRRMVLQQILLLLNVLGWELLSNPMLIPPVGRFVPGKCTPCAAKTQLLCPHLYG